MAKVVETRKIQRRRTEVAMRRALQDFINGKAQISIPPQDDDTEIILRDCIEELLELRQIVEDVKSFASSITVKTARR